MEGGLAPVVEGVQGDAVLEQDVDHHVLTIVAGNVEWGATIGVDGIRLQGWSTYICVSSSKYYYVSDQIYAYHISIARFDEFTCTCT